MRLIQISVQIFAAYIRIDGVERYFGVFAIDDLPHCGISQEDVNKMNERKNQW